MRNIFLSSVALIGLLALPAQAEAMTGNELYEACQSGYVDTFRHCTGYLAGVIQGMQAYNALILDAGPMYCITDGTTNGQLAEMVAATLRDMPAQRHLPAAVFVIRTFNDFLCD